MAGCGSKKVLKCKLQGQQSGVDSTQYIEGTFEGNRLTKMTLKAEYDMSEFPSSYRDQFVESSKQTIKEKLKGEGKAEAKTEGDLVIINVDLDIKNMSDEAKKSLDIIDTKGSPSETKKYLEKRGYTCE